MVVRAWRGYAAAAESQAYPAHLLETVRPELAVVEPEARAALVRFDDTVQHYEVLAAPNGAGDVG